MKKIASPQELRVELGAILSQTLADNPSRNVLAFELRDLANRLAASPITFTKSDVRSLATRYKFSFRDTVNFLSDLLGSNAPSWIPKLIDAYERRKERDADR